MGMGINLSSIIVSLYNPANKGVFKNAAFKVKKCGDKSNILHVITKTYFKLNILIFMIPSLN